jgi:hypothetical protein
MFKPRHPEYGVLLPTTGLRPVMKFFIFSFKDRDMQLRKSVGQKPGKVLHGLRANTPQLQTPLYENETHLIKYIL